MYKFAIVRLRNSLTTKYPAAVGKFICAYLSLFKNKCAVKSRTIVAVYRPFSRLASHSEMFNLLEKELTIKFVTSKLVELPIFND